MSGIKVEPNIEQAQLDLIEYEKKWKIIDFKTTKIAREINVLKANVEVLESECEENNNALSTLEENCETMEMNATTTFIQINKAKLALERRIYIIDKYMKYMEPEEVQTVPPEAPDGQDDEISYLQEEMAKTMADIHRNNNTLNNFYLQISMKNY